MCATELYLKWSKRNVLSFLQSIRGHPTAWLWTTFCFWCVGLFDFLCHCSSLFVPAFLYYLLVWVFFVVTGVFTKMESCSLEFENWSTAKLNHYPFLMLVPHTLFYNTLSNWLYLILMTTVRSWSWDCVYRRVSSDSVRVMIQFFKGLNFWSDSNNYVFSTSGSC